MVKKKRAWNNTNSLYRYLHRRKTATARVARVKRYRKVNTMARKRRYGRKGGLMSGGLMSWAVPIAIGAFGTPIAQRIPMVNQIPAQVQTPALAAGVAVITKKNPIKYAIGAFVGSILAGSVLKGIGQNATDY